MIYSMKVVIDEKKVSLCKMCFCVLVFYFKFFDFFIGVLKVFIGVGYVSVFKISEVINE